MDFSRGLIGIFQVVYLGFTGGSFGIFQVVYVEDTRPEVVVVDQPAVVAPVAPAGVCTSLFLVFTKVNFFLFVAILKFVPFLVQPYYVRPPVRGKKTKFDMKKQYKMLYIACRLHLMKMT